MGKTHAQLVDEFGEVELVVLHNAINYRDPEDEKTDPAEYGYRTAMRGETIMTNGKEAKRLLDLGSAARPGSEAAGYAEAGMRDPSALHAPPSATAMIASEAEQVNAVKAASVPTGDPSALLKLEFDQLCIVAKAYGVEVKKNDTKDSLAKRIADPTAAAQAEADAASLRAHRDTLTGPSTPVLPEYHPDAQQPDETAEPDDDEIPTAEVKASKGAVESAQSLGVDLALVTGTGAKGMVTKPDVVKYAADHPSGD